MMEKRENEKLESKKQTHINPQRPVLEKNGGDEESKKGRMEDA